MFGLGLLGGGVATTCWLLEQGARVTVTDIKDAKQLAPSVRRVEEYLKKIARDGKAYEKLRVRLTWALGGHSHALIDAAQIVVANPDVTLQNPFIQRALNRGIVVANEGTLFYDTWKKKTIGITGTRGKTTTAHWTHHFISGSLLAGNSTTKPFQSVMDSVAPVAVTELSSFILEHFDRVRRGPQVAVITNLYRDHLNRHGTMEEYARTKAVIFARQGKDDVLILNHDDDWAAWFARRHTAGRVRYTSFRPLPAELEGVWYTDGAVYERVGEKTRNVLDVSSVAERWGRHNMANLLAATLAARACGVSWSVIQSKVASLPQVPYRQEVVHRDRAVTIVNDTTATSPEGGIAAVERWGGPNCILIAGGTNRDLDYRSWAQALKGRIRPTNLILLAGSATDAMRKVLGPWGRGIRSYDTLEQAWRAARKRSGLFISSIVLFSPAAKSFGLFANEFDRGQQFNQIVKREFGT